MKKTIKKTTLLRVILQCIPILIMVIVTIIYLLSGKKMTVHEIINYSPSNKWLAGLFLICMYAFKSLTVVFPIFVLFIAGGILFNTPLAILINTIGSAVCISVPYWIGKFSGSNLTNQLTMKYEKIQKISSLQQKNDWFFSYIVRVVGILPCDIVSLYMGTIKLPYFKYLFGGLLGFLPSIIAATIIGVTITNPLSPEFMFSCLMNATLSVVSFCIYRKMMKRDIKRDKNKK